MKAITYRNYGSPDVLQLKNAEKPAPGDNEVLVEVHAASVNYSDWAFVRGVPFLIRLLGGGLLKPKNKILGADIAGQVVTVGRNVKLFQPGDEVYSDLSGCDWGGFSEYVAVPERAVALKPTNLSFEEAAAVPQAAVVALQGLRNEGQIQPEYKVLINGASGGIGTFAVQIAKSFGAEVTGVCSSRNSEMVRSIGADQVIDYTHDDFTKNGQRYDLILDIVANHSLSDLERALSSKGVYVFVGGSISAVLKVSINKSEKIRNVSAEPNQADLFFMKDLIEAGKVVPVIDRCYPFNETSEAVRYYGERHSQGKVVITIGNENK
jgi:NADPH:quinone reductase-like Zn-dependent oxidoreductase